MHRIKKNCCLVLLVTACMVSGCSKRQELVIMPLSDEGETETAADDIEGVNAAGISTQEEDVQNLQNTDSDTQSENAASRVRQPEQTPAIEERIVVHVCGAVVNPGVYELNAGSRVCDAICAAGGFHEEADKDYVNQAQVLADGTQLVIPTFEQTENGFENGLSIPSSQSDASASGKINLNTASKEELCKIPGIGQSRADAIVSYREQNGRFQAIEDIMQVSGIKQATYEKIKDSITVN